MVPRYFRKKKVNCENVWRAHNWREVQLIWDTYDNEKASLFLEATWSVPWRYNRGHSSASCRVTCFHFYRRHQVSAQVSRGGAGWSGEPAYIHGTTFSSSSQKRIDLRDKVVHWWQSTRHVIFSETRRDMYYLNDSNLQRIWHWSPHHTPSFSLSLPSSLSFFYQLESLPSSHFKYFRKTREENWKKLQKPWRSPRGEAEGRDKRGHLFPLGISKK